MSVQKENEIRVQQYAVVRGAIDSIFLNRNFHSKAYSAWLGAFATGYGLLLIKSEGCLLPFEVFLASLLSVAGIVTSLIWAFHGSLHSRDLRARYEVLKDMEIHLPEKAFTKELDLRKAKKQQSGVDQGSDPETDVSNQISKKSGILYFFDSKLLVLTPFLATAVFFMLLFGALYQPWNW